MAFGMEVYDENGNVTFSSEALEAFYLGSFVANSRSGSFTVPNSSQYTHVWAQSGGLWGEIGGSSDIGVWVEGRTIKWQYFFANPGQCTIRYGGYSR